MFQSRLSRSKVVSTLSESTKKLLPGELRFIAKKYIGKTWGIYDKARGSWPIQTPDTGIVEQGVTKEVAEATAEALNKKVGIIK